MTSIRTHQAAYLLLEDGTFFEGRAVGKIGTATGEICFNTGMTGYQEIFTDPSYFGQLMLTTNAHIGNYGTHDDEMEAGSVKIAGLICKNFNDGYSRPIATGNTQSLQRFAEWEGLVGIADIDTRMLVRHIRSKGAMNGIISSEILEKNELKKALKKVPSMVGLELSSHVTTKEPYTIGNPDAKYKVAVMDYGVKRSILNCFQGRDCFLTVFPANATLDEINEFEPNAYFLSNGPGDPAAMTDATETVKAMLRTGKPIFGICLGHQLLAQAVGIPTYKMHHGHRGINHPVLNLQTNRSEITSQNHGFGVSPEAVYAHPNITVTHRNLNDDTIEGIKLNDYPAFSVQYHPEASPGPHDSRYLFDDFVGLMQQQA
jgi:carbamoyl-phosphate synthase small subunit